MVCWCAMSLAVKKEEITLQVIKKNTFHRGLDGFIHQALLSTHGVYFPPAFSPNVWKSVPQGTTKQSPLWEMGIGDLGVTEWYYNHNHNHHDNPYKHKYKNTEP